MTPNRTSCHGFTLLELVVVIGLVGLLLALMTLNGPVFLGHQRLATGARQVATDLRLVRAKAVAQTWRYRVVFTAGAGSYVAERDDGSGGWDPHALHGKDLVAAAAVPVPLPASVSLVESLTVEFEGRGNVTAPTTLRLQSGALPGVEQVVRVSFTGEVQVQ